MQGQGKVKLILKQIESFLPILIIIVKESFIDASIKEKLLTCCETARVVLYIVNNFPVYNKPITKSGIKPKAMVRRTVITNNSLWLALTSIVTS